MCMRGAILVTDAKNADVSVLQGRFLYTFPIEYNLKRLKVIVSRARAFYRQEMCTKLRSHLSTIFQKPTFFSPEGSFSFCHKI